MISFREARLRAGLSQEEAAKQIGVTAAAISYWETGQYVPRTQKIRKVAQVYGVRVGDLLGDE